MSDTWGILSKSLKKPSGALELSNHLINIEFDVITTERHKWGASITSNPVEDGSFVADHVGLTPDSLDITAVISNASLERWKGEFLEKLFNIFDGESNIQKAFDQLRKLLESRQPVVIYTRYRCYTDMVLTSLSIPRTKDSGDAIEFDASFTHIKRVSTLIVDAADAGIYPEKTESESTKRKSESPKNKGSTPPTQTDEETKTKVENVAAKSEEALKKAMESMNNHQYDDK